MVNNTIVTLCGIQHTAISTNCLKNGILECSTNVTTIIPPTLIKIQCLRFTVCFLNNNLFTTNRADWSKLPTVCVWTCIYLIYWKDLDCKHSLNSCRNSCLPSLMWCTDCHVLYIDHFISKLLHNTHWKILMSQR